MTSLRALTLLPFFAADAFVGSSGIPTKIHQFNDATFQYHHANIALHEKLEAGGVMVDDDEGAPPLTGRKRRSLRRAYLKVRNAVVKSEKDDDGRILTAEEITDKVFNQIDTNRDNILSEEELRASGMEFSAIQPLDANFNGQIERAEFRRAAQVSMAEPMENNKPGIVDELKDFLGEFEYMERQERRVDGFEPYILVSILSAQASFEEISDTEVDWDLVFSSSQLSDLIRVDWYNAGILVSSAVAAICGMYATVVFSLTILYGKTALGMDRDDAYFEFMSSTGTQRSRGFQAFSFGLLTFCFSIMLEVCRRAPEQARLPLVVVSIVVIYFAKQEYNVMIDAAAPIFAPKARQDDDDDDDEELWGN